MGVDGMQGLHLLGEWRACRAGYAALTEVDALRALCLRLVDEAGLKIVGDRFHQFPQGVTGMILLTESHLAVRTWPEHGAVTADLYVCNLQQDNSNRARSVFAALRAAFQPQEPVDREVWRGTASETRAPLLAEWLTDDCGHFIKPTTQLAADRSALQDLKVWDTQAFGRLFQLDGGFMSSEADEFFYHENLVHLPAIAHPAPRSALVIGGGDGGSADELLKHPSIDAITVVEIDPAVISMARRYFAAIHHGALDHPRVRVVVEDGLAYLQRETASYDLLVLDLTDPGGPSAPLYTPEFYALCASRLNPGGALSMHVGAPFFQPQRFARTLKEIRSAFALVRPYLVAVPLYGALWGFACAAQTLDPKALSGDEVALRLAARGIGFLRYYNAETHGAMLALPGFVQDIVRAANS